MSYGQFKEPRANKIVLKAMGGHEITWGMGIVLKSELWIFQCLDLGKFEMTQQRRPKGIATEVDEQPRW